LGLKIKFKKSTQNLYLKTYFIYKKHEYRIKDIIIYFKKRTKILNIERSGNGGGRQAEWNKITTILI